MTRRQPVLTVLLGTLLAVSTVPFSAAHAPGPPGGESRDAAATAARAHDAGTDETIPLDALSPSFLGMYRKVMEIEDRILRHSFRYGVDFDLARALCIYESGGNPDLTSWAGAEGYFQVMPATFRTLRVNSNIEAGIKYLAQLIDRFEREDYALAAYNGGPTNVGRRRAMRLESLQYVIGIGHYRSVLKQHEAVLRPHARQLELTEVREDEGWWELSRRLGIPPVELRLHNPYLSHRRLRAGHRIVHPPRSRGPLLERRDGEWFYRTRIGDNYFTLAFALDVELDRLRDANGLWRLQSIPADFELRVPLEWEGEHRLHRVREGEGLGEIAERLDSDPWRIIRDNGLLWGVEPEAGMVLRVREVPEEPRYLVYRVRRGDTLTSISRRYGASIDSIQEANRMGRRTVIRVGESLRVPLVPE